jgi:hypothetical protein
MSDLSSIEEELSQLRAENRRLRAEQEAQVGMVRVLAPELTAVWPTRIEMTAIFDAINTRWPRDFENVEHDAFARTFRILGGFHRQPDLDHEHSVGHWVQAVNERLSRRGEQGIRYMDLVAAVVAWSDIEITDWRLRETEGVPLEFSLNEYVGRLPTDQWRATLRGEFTKLVDPRPRQRVGDGRTPRPVVLIDGRPLPNEMRYVGPRYQFDF